jgi:cellobiose phosphorylase
MRYGHFDDEHREYVITRPDTPVPWINYLGTDAYFGIISNTAGGYSCYRDARLRRLTRYRYNGVPTDSGGRYLYLRDNGTGEYWSPSWQPTRHDLDSYECRHGLSHTRISSARLGVRAETLYFVPPGETLEVWRLRVHNERGTPADLSVFSSAEFCLWDAQDDATNFQRNYSTGEVEVDGGVIYHKTEYRERRDHFAYFACSEPLTGFDTQREEFLGPYRGWDRPLTVERGESANSVARGWAPHGSHHVRFLLAPGETKEVIFLLGYWENPRDQKFDPPGSNVLNKALVRPVIDWWLRPAAVAEGFRRLRESWESLLSVLRVDTPDEDTNRMVNVWNPYQCMVTFNMSRSVSLFESGISRGIGFRDSCQLPLIGRADWNDCLNLNCFSAEPGQSFQTTENVTGSTAESAFIGGLFVLAAREFAPIAERRGGAGDAGYYRAEAEKMAGVIAEHGWDGAWFRRAYDHSGHAVGSAADAEGQIFIEPQGMCVMSGVGVGDGMAVRALDSVRERLATSHGILLLQPAYTRYHLELGEISSYPPGYKENGSVFCHTNPWVMIAEAMVGRGDAAFGYYRRINPSAREEISDVHRCEPYVYAQMIAGRDAPTQGEAKNSWLTGTAAWNLVAITQWILGIRAELDGLRVDPVLPAAWAGYTATRRFRGATYQISVRNPDRVSGRVTHLEVQGQPIEGTLVPPAPAGTTVHVEAVIQAGSPSALGPGGAGARAGRGSGPPTRSRRPGRPG